MKKYLFVFLLLSGLCCSFCGCTRSVSPRERRVEFLMRQIEMHTSEDRLAAIRELGELKESTAMWPLISMLYEPRSDVRAAAAEALGMIGDRRATEHIVKLLAPGRHWSVRKAAARALGDLADPAAIDSLVQALGDEKDTVAYSASVALGAIGQKSVAPVVGAFRDATNGVKSDCTMAISMIGDPAAKPELREMLSGEEPELRIAAVKALCGMEDRDSFAEIVKLLDDKEVRQRVQEALLPVKEKAVGHVAEGLIAGLTTEPGKLAAMHVLDKTGGPEIVDPLLKAMYDTGRRVPKSARKILAAHAKEAGVVRALKRVMRGEDQRSALGALVIAKGAGDGIPVDAVTGSLESKDAEVRRAAVDLLGSIGGDTAIEPLAGALADEDEQVRIRAALELARRGDDRGKDVAAKALGDATDRTTVKMAIDALVALKATEAVKPLVALLGNDDKSVAGAAVDALGAMGVKSASGALAPLLKSKDAGIVHRTVKALGLIGNQDSVPALTPLLKSADKRVVGLAAEALGRIGHAEALGPMLELLKTEDERLKHNIIRALGHLGNPRAINHLAPFLKPLHDCVAQEAEYLAMLEKLKPQLDEYKKARAEWKPKFKAWEKENAEWEKLARVAKKNGSTKDLPPRPVQPVAPKPPIRQKRASRPKFKTEMIVIEALGNIGDAKAIDLILPLFSGYMQGGFGSIDNMTLKGMDALAKIPGERAFKELVTAFNKISTFRFYAGMRVRAMRIVAGCNPKGAVPVVIDALEKTEGMDYKALAGLLKIAGEIGDEQMFPIIIRWLRHDIADVRKQARDAFAKIGSRKPEEVIKYMGQVKVGFRSYVSTVFKWMGPEVLPHLTKALELEKSPQARQGICWALGHMGNPDALDALFKTLEHDEHPKVRGAAIWAMGQIGDRGATEKLIPALKNEDPQARMAAAEALGKISDIGAQAALIASLKDEVHHVRSAAALALGRLGDPGARAALLEAQKDANGEVAGTAGRALMMLESGPGK